MTSPVSAVIFDCDGVLVNSEELALEVELRLLAEAGLVYDRADYMARFLGAGEEAWWQSLEADGLARLRRPIVHELREPLRIRMRAAIDERLAEIPGARAAIARVRRPKAVASSSGRRSLGIKLRKVGHWDLFAPHIYSGEDMAAPKPAPDLFLHAADRLGVDPAQCLVVEDSINGVTAGRAAGMHVWGFTGGAHHIDGSGDQLVAAGAGRIVASWQEAAALFEEL
jgi:HAD superfamily hydrolase (TIGR01509 family)